MVKYKVKDGYAVIDYAHTPSSLQSILESVKAYAKGRVICAWGVGGDRDATKKTFLSHIV